MIYFQIGDCGIGFSELPDSLLSDQSLLQFSVNEPDHRELIRYELSVLDEAAFHDSQILHGDSSYELLKLGDRCFFMNHWAFSRFAYGFWIEDTAKDSTVSLYMNPALAPEYPLTGQQFISSIGLHRNFLQRGAAILHASYIDIGGEAILFTAPSGTGKSTQAELWRKFAGAEVVNGDRALIRICDGGWQAYGYPCSGSSGICLNRTLPLRAIVVLAQHTENVVERMTYPAKIRALVSATEVFPWLNEDIDMAFRIAEQVAAQVPIIRLRCRPDRGAVECLTNFLEENR